MSRYDLRMILKYRLIKKIFGGDLIGFPAEQFRNRGYQADLITVLYIQNIRNG
jgi:hypothetical protein